MSDAGGVVVVGASDKTPWSYWLMHNLDAYRYPGPVWPVNPKGTTDFGWKCLASLDELPAVPALAAVMVRADAAVDAVESLLRLGTRRFLLVSAGFAETRTPDGVALQARLVEQCAAAGAEVYGPNCVGFASFTESLCAIAEPVPLDVVPGPVSLVSQSGAVMSAAMSTLASSAVGLDECWSIGNGAVFDLVAAIARVSRRPTTRVVCVVLEGVLDGDRFAEVVEQGRAAGVTYVVLRLGRSARGRAIAQSHTGTVVGADAMTAAWLTSLGVHQVDTLDQLAAVAAVATRLSGPVAGGVFVHSGSGGGSGYAADLADRHGLRLAEVGAATRAELEACLPPGALVSNPLDMVGGSPTTRGRIYDAVHADPGVGVVLEPYTVQWPDDGEGRRFHRAGMEQLAAAARPGVLTVIAGIFHQLPTRWVAEYRDRTDVLVLPDLDDAIRALAEFVPAGQDGSGHEAAVGVAAGTGVVVAEAAGRELFEKLGLPLVPGARAVGADEAVRAATTLPAPYVVKIALPDVGHKQRIGGVLVGLSTPDDVRRAAEEIEAAALAHGALAAGPATFLVQHQASGPELLVALLRDRVAGAVLTIGVGGWAAELGPPVMTLALPAAAPAIAQGLRTSGLLRVLGDRRARELTDVAAGLAHEFVHGGLTGFGTVECNPVMLTAGGPLIADVLLVADRPNPLSEETHD